MCGHTCSLRVQRKKNNLFFSYIVPIGSARFDGQEDLLHESNENTIKAEKGKHRETTITRNYSRKRMSKTIVRFLDSAQT